MRRKGLPLLAVFVLLALAGCVAPQVPTASTSPSPAIVDPLTTIADSSSPDFVAAHLSPVLHKTGEGPSIYRFDASAGGGSVRSYLACAPAGKFKVTIAGKSYWGECARRFTATADVPFTTDSPRSEVVKVSVAERMRFMLLLIPTPRT